MKVFIASMGVTVLLSAFLMWAITGATEPALLVLGGSMITVSQAVTFEWVPTNPASIDQMAGRIVDRRSAVEALIASHTATWLADERPAFESVGDFERCIGRVIGLKTPPRGDRPSS